MRLITLILITISIHSSTSDYISLPHPTPLTLKCKVHHLNKCDRHCNVCESDNLNITSAQTYLTEVTGFSVRNVAFHNNVVRLSINNQICHFLPQGTDKFFSNLETLRIWSSGLKRLTQNDIKGFSNLKELILPLNEIETLDSNLFEYNKGITKLDLSRNKLHHVGLALFSSVPSLLNVNFNHNECIDDNFKNNAAIFIDKVRRSCPPTIEMLKDDVVYLIDQNEVLKLIIDAKDKVIKENCDYTKFEEAEPTRFVEKSETGSYWQLDGTNDDFNNNRYAEIEIK